MRANLVSTETHKNVDSPTTIISVSVFGIIDCTSILFNCTNNEYELTKNGKELESDIYTMAKFGEIPESRTS